MVKEKRNTRPTEVLKKTQELKELTRFGIKVVPYSRTSKKKTTAINSLLVTEKFVYDLILRRILSFGGNFLQTRTH